MNHSPYSHDLPDIDECLSVLNTVGAGHVERLKFSQGLSVEKMANRIYGHEPRATWGLGAFVLDSTGSNTWIPLSQEQWRLVTPIRNNVIMFGYITSIGHRRKR